jgi:tetratricopeptide (TPR) repeat protein
VLRAAGRQMAGGLEEAAIQFQAGNWEFGEPMPSWTAPSRTPPSTMADPPKSICGGDFDAYMHHTCGPFLRSEYGDPPNHFRRLDVWKGRRLEVLQADGGQLWTSGRVVVLTQAWDEAMFNRSQWTMSVALDGSADPVTFRVHRCDIQRGGILNPHHGDIQRSETRADIAAHKIKLSFKWLSKAEPEVNLHADASCPLCRAVEPPCLDSMKELTAGECPVCFTESDQNIKLDCGHLVCKTCWIQWSDRDDGFAAAFTGIAPPLSEEQAASLAANTKMFAGLPNTATKDKQSRGQYTKGIVHFLHVEARRHRPEEDPRAVASRVFATEPTMMVVSDEMMAPYLTTGDQNKMFGVTLFDRESHRDIYGNISPSYRDIYIAQALVEVLVRRKDEANAALVEINWRSRSWLDRVLCSSMLQPRTAEHYLHRLCCAVGEMLEERGRYHVAIKWYRKAVEICEASPALQNRDPVPAYALASDYGNLGLALKRSGYLAEALEAYDKALRVCPMTVQLNNRLTLLEELAEWTGTAHEYDIGQIKADGVQLSSHLPAVGEAWATDQRQAVLSIRICAGLVVHCWYFSDSVHGMMWYWVEEGWIGWFFWFCLCNAVATIVKLNYLRVTTTIAAGAWSHKRWIDPSDGSENFTRDRISSVGMAVFVGAVAVNLYVAYTIHWLVCIAGCAFGVWFAAEPWRVYIDTPFESDFSVAWRHAQSSAEEDDVIRRFGYGNGIEHNQHLE